ncbi:MAG TPA: MOSC N-terminal beta barrel domain-containing protein [Solirubrobacteraceae bacterium]|nr:MOSC N-terminal beta barrel domain-containing protein [Solirubrobacteraceae bacterium]
MTSPTVVALQTTPVKGLRVVAREAIELTETGVDDDRRFYLVDERGRMVNGKLLGGLHEVVATLDGDELGLTFPDGSTVTGPIVLAEETLATTFFSRPTPARELVGAFGPALSEHVGRRLRVVEGVHRKALDRGRGGAASFVSRASLRAIARLASDHVDARRFRMLVEVDGLREAHDEDTWVGQSLHVGGALVRVRGHVGRCLTTQRNPETGTPDVPMLDLLRFYRSGLDTTEPLAFGVYGEVLEPGRVAIGDPIELIGSA